MYTLMRRLLQLKHPLRLLVWPRLSSRCLCCIDVRRRLSSRLLLLMLLLLGRLLELAYGGVCIPPDDSDSVAVE